MDALDQQEPDDGPRGIAAVFGPTINGIIAPEKAFAALHARPVLTVWPLLWTVVGMIGLAVWNLEVTRQMIRVGAIESMMQQGQTPDPEQLARMFETMDRFAPFWAVGGNLFILVLVALIAVALWVGSSLLGGRTNFGRSLGVASIGALIHPLLATTFVSAMWKMNPPEIRRIRDVFETMPSLGLDILFKGSDLSLFWRGLLSRVDLFNVWWVVVVAIGGEKLLGLKRNQAIGLAVTLWAVTAVIAALWAGLNT